MQENARVCLTLHARIEKTFPDHRMCFQVHFVYFVCHFFHTQPASKVSCMGKHGSSTRDVAFILDDFESNVLFNCLSNILLSCTLEGNELQQVPQVRSAYLRLVCVFQRYMKQPHQNTVSIESTTAFQWQMKV